jgi:hypothetical protein
MSCLLWQKFLAGTFGGNFLAGIFFGGNFFGGNFFWRELLYPDPISGDAGCEVVLSKRSSFLRERVFKTFHPTPCLTKLFSSFVIS